MVNLFKQLNDTTYQISAYVVDDVLNFAKLKGWTIAVGPFDTGNRDGYNHIFQIVIKKAAAPAPIPVTPSKPAPPVVIPVTPAPPAAKTWEQMSETEQKAAVQDAWKNINTTDEKELINEIATQLKITPDKARNVYNNVSGKTADVGPFDLLDFTIIAGLAATAGAVIFKIISKVMAKKVGTIAAEAATKLTAKELGLTASQAAKKAAVEMTSTELEERVIDTIIKNPDMLVTYLQYIPKAGLADFTRIAQGLVSKVGAKNAVTLSTKIPTTVSAVIRKKLNTGILTALIKDIKAYPIITVFAVTEIPQFFLMLQFARNQLAQEAGTTATQLSFNLKKYEDSLKEAGYSFTTAVTAKNYALASTILDGMAATATAYEKAIEDNKAQLQQLNSYENSVFLLQTYESAIIANRAKLPVTSVAIPSNLPESIDVQITKVTDGDTVTAEVQDVNKTVYDVRILGENAPDKDLSVYWVKSLINGVEKRYELKAADYKAANAYAVTNLMRAYVKLLIDPANRVDKYGRVLAVVMYKNGARNFGLDMVERGLAVAYLQDKNKYVNDAQFISAQEWAHSQKVGIWATAAAKAAASNFKIRIESTPSNAKLFIDGIATHHNTPSDEKELKDVMSLLTPGTHEIKVSKALKEAKQNVTITADDNGVITLVIT